jgi:hypothetical protein
MKKIVSFLMFFFLIVANTGCEKEKALKDLVVGKWEIKSQTMVSYKNNVKTGELTDYLDANEQTIEIFSDGTGNHYSAGVVDDTFTWTLEGSTMTVVLTSDTMVLEVSVSGDTMNYTITETIVDGADTYKTVMTVVTNRISS